ncbi:imelysin family protein [Methylopila henanensis]|uniref:Imelysin family protein n=1 Tax=Methylopila henanensis TaxID=873516 RepID=A0ABW4K1P4_9HYPH
MAYRFASVAILMAALAAPAAAAGPEPGPLAVSVIEDWLLPRYDALVATTAEQRDAWRSACADGDYVAELADLRERFQAASDAWSAVEHVTTGPVSLALRPDRIFFFPDRRNAVAKALGELEDKAATDEIAPDAFRAGSVAGQGYPALERLLFDPDDAGSAARCRVGAAVAANLATLAGAIRDEWAAPAGPLAKLKAGQGDPVHFADPSQAAARLMTDLAGGLQRAVDVKLLPVLGGSADAAKPKSAEGWRAGRSARALKVATASLAAMAKAFAAAAPKPIAATDAKAFAAAEAAVARLPNDLGEAASDPKRRKVVEAAVAALKGAQADVAKNLAPALGVRLGFNALDGD